MGERFARSARRAEWLDIELRHLVALQTVARARSFRGAAQELGYVQSAVSQQIAYLERTLRVRLLERARGHAPTQLTAAGEVVLAHVEDILADLRAAQVETEAVASGLVGTIRLGAFDDAAELLVPRLLRRFAIGSPNVEVRVIQQASDTTLLRMTGAGEVDVTFAELPVVDARLESFELLSEPRVLIRPAGSAPARKVPLVRQRGSRCFQEVEAALIASGIEPSVVREADSTAGVQALVGAGVGSAVVPRMAVDTTDDRIDVVELDGAFGPRCLGLVWRRDRSSGVLLDGLLEAAIGVTRPDRDGNHAVRLAATIE